jgi:hypothetical protein
MSQRARPPRLALLAVPVALASGCGLLGGYRTLEERQWDPPPEPLAFTFQGEIRDFATMRTEPEARIEFWSDEPDYLPIATVTPDGSYSVLVDRCRRKLTLVEQLAVSFLVTDPGTCAVPINRFGLRARLGDRCSFAIEYGGPGWEKRPDTLWLHPCRSPTRAIHPWRTALHAGQAAASR